MAKFNFDYSEYSDILHIHKNGQNTRGSIELGDFTLDFGNNDDIIGVEIEHASEFFSSLDIGKDDLCKIEHAELIIDKRNPQYHIIFMKLELPMGVKNIPLPMPVVASA